MTDMNTTWIGQLLTVVESTDPRSPDVQETSSMRHKRR